MKKILFATLFVSASFWVAGYANAQVIPNALIGKVQQIENTIEFTINADQPFYVGANVYILKIGKQNFSISRQLDMDGKGTLVFLIPASDYSKLAEGDKIFLTYGEDFVGEENTVEELQDACKILPNKCKYLGVFAKKLLSK